MRWNSIILARGGSKRLHGKNFSVELLPGETLLELAIRKALAVFGETTVSSDKEEILGIASAHGARTVMSPHHSDESTSVDAVLFAADRIGLEADSRIALLQVSSPLVDEVELRKAVTAYESGSSPVFCAYAEPRISWAWGKDGPVFPELQGKRSQDLPVFMLPCGAFYLIGLSVLRKNMSFMRGAKPFLVDPWKAIDIDTEEDLEVARCRARRSGCQTQQSQ